LGSGQSLKFLHEAVADSPELNSLAGFLRGRPSASESRAAGRAFRTKVPRKSLGEWAAGPDRPDPVALLEMQNAQRLASLVPLRMGRMAASPFAFLRGAAAVMASDLSQLPHSGIDVMACGDMHLLNFGLFASAERNLIFAINDFDEAHPGPWEWDLRRLVASAAVAARFMGGDRHNARDAAERAAQSYVSKIGDYASMSPLRIWYDRIDEAAILRAVPAEIEPMIRRMMAKAHGRGHQRSLERLTERQDGARRLIEDRPIIVRETHTVDGIPVPVALDELLRGYIASLPKDRAYLLSRYRIVDIVRKIVGVGSVGTSCWVVYLEGSGKDDPLFLQLKEAVPSVLAGYVKTDQNWENQGHRVVVGQRFTQGSPDIFLGWGRSTGPRSRDFYVRQLADMKGSFGLVENDRAGLGWLGLYVELCGRALALAHAKSGQAALISGYCGSSNAVPDALGSFAIRYADQTVADHDRLLTAIRSGAVSATMGV
jgi:uncharacterized protein (DUF2252 family)